MNVMDARPLKAAIQELADELADLPNFSKEYKKAVAAARKKHAYMSGEGAATFIVNTAEKWADEMRQDRAERGSHSRVAPMESIQDRMAHLLEAGNASSETMEVLVDALKEIVRNCERRLRKGHDEGDASTLAVAKAALAKAGMGGGGSAKPIRMSGFGESVDDTEIAAWAQNSYPEKGDAAFLVHGTTTPGGLAGDIFGGLKAHFVARPFIMDIQRVLADMRDEAAVSIKSQEDARKLYNKHAEDFLRAMYKAHGNGKKPYGDNYEAVEKWVKSKVKK